MPARTRSGAARSSWGDRAAVAVAVVLIGVVMSAGLWQVIRFARIWVNDPGLATVCLAIGAVVVLGPMQAHRWVAARRQDRADRFRRLTERPARHDLDGYRQLLAALRRRSPIALAQLSSRPALIDGLFFHARRGDLRRELQPFADRLRKCPNPVTRALASLHPDGHVCEAAVSAMVERPRPEYVPFLAERAVEWVEPVRRRALAGLHRMLTEQPARYRPLVARELSRFAARRHGPALAALLDQVSASRTG
ncbi:hypothetical protein [Dactylosporangium maewongense]|uniref:hypothetical protein n=1 Tax=Dactylosporangium maewongense TaxID=634393 RepID=UPI0031D31AFB